MKLRILFAGLMFGLAALAADSGAELFQKAVTQERAAGNLEEAIKLYQRVAKEFASDRALAAKALVQAAQCYELLGQDERPSSSMNRSRATLAISVNQPRRRTPGWPCCGRETRCGAGHHDATQDRVAAFEQSLLCFFKRTASAPVYKDAATGALMISDLAGKEKRVIFKPKAGDAGFLCPPGIFPWLIWT